jgi:hypothetical protein
MKRFLSLLLTLAICLPLLSCGAELITDPISNEANTTATKEDAASQGNGKLKTIPYIADKLSREKINAFPTVNENMTVEEARKLCVDFFRFCQTFAWTPDESLRYERNSKGDITELRAGTIYGGLPYGGVSSGNIYRLMEYYDEETGVVDMSKATPEGQTILFANQCSIGAYWGWGRVINSADYDWTDKMVPKNGFIPVGNYTYRYMNTLGSFSQKSTGDICKENGVDIMFDAYSKMKPADGLVAFDSAGHVIMCSSTPTVVKTNGKIDGSKSYFTVIDQGQAFHQMEQSDGTKYLVQGGVDRKVTFRGAFESGYLPFTFAEFLGTDGLESPKATLELGESATIDQFRSATLRSNYGISDVFVTYLNEDGTAAGYKTIRSKTAGVMSLEMASSFMGGALVPYVGKTMRIEVQQSSGARLIAWEGTITK